MRGLRLILLAIACAVTQTSAVAQTETVLHSFRGGGHPESRLLLGKSGELFGTVSGGTRSLGNAYELVQRQGVWKRILVYRFHGADGSQPAAGLVQGLDGSLYGTTASGGNDGFGTVFELTRSQGVWTEHVLNNFNVDSGGKFPMETLTLDPATGELYGTTYEGGAGNCGTVFQMGKSHGVWMLATIYEFQASKSDGCYPSASLLEDSSGALYGATSQGGPTGTGTIFELVKSGGSWTETILYGFAGGLDAASPDDLVQDSTGALYASTGGGGANRFGSAIELSKSNGVWKESLLHSFNANGDGTTPSGILLDGATGSLYVTTADGGTNGNVGHGGTLAVLTFSNGAWNESILHSFGGNGDGNTPNARVIEDPNTSTLYGTTFQGGTAGAGTVYQLIP